MTETDMRALRKRDFWAAIVLLCLSLFFLWRTSLLPFLKASAAGVTAEWYTSAALVPYGVFGMLLLLSLGLMTHAIRGGGLPDFAGAGDRVASVERATILKIAAICVILFFYIGALVPRVDFTIASALVVTAMIIGFHEGRPVQIAMAVGAVAIAGLYAMIFHWPQSEWTGPFDDDWLTLALFAVLSVAAAIEAARTHGKLPGYAFAAPVIGLVIPFLLVCAMAFGFRQNVPNRTGLLFKTVEYQYYVTVRPWLRGE